MDFSLSDEQKAISELSEKILTDQSTLERLKALEDSDECIDRDTWGKLAEAGLLGVALPEKFGGAGAGFVEICLILEQIGRAVSHVPFLPTVVSGALPIATFGSDAQKQELLPGVCSGTTLLTAALSEAAADPRIPTTTAQATENGYRLNGVKVGVPIAAQSKRIVVPARKDDGEVLLFLVDPQSEGVALEAQTTFNWETHYRVSFQDTPVSSEDRLGDEGQGDEILGWLLDRTLTALTAIASGVAQSALSITAGYAAERKQFNKPISTFQAVSQRMGDCFIDNEAMNLTMWQAATRLAEDMPSDREIAIAKFWAGHGGSRIGHAALHVHGGISIDVDYPIQRYFLWAKQIQYTLGADTEQLKRLGSVIAEG